MRVFAFSSFAHFFLSLRFFSPGKELNYIQAFFLSRCRVNVITKIGFGIGELKTQSHPFLIGDHLPGFNYILGIDHVDFDIQIPYQNPEDFLTFKWFKHNVICRDQPWICDQERGESSATQINSPPARASSSHDEFRRRKALSWHQTRKS